MKTLLSDKELPKPTLWMKVKLWQTLRHLKSEYPEQRIRAVTELGVLRGPVALTPLMGALLDPDVSVREAAGEVLSEIDPHWAELEITRSAIPKLLTALKDDHWEVRQAAAQTLGKIRDERAVKPLVLATLRVDNWMVRSAAAEALAKIGDSGANRALTAALKHQNAAVRKRAAEALKKIDPTWEASETADKPSQEGAG
ncbi:MAG: HEAT repeat domain-containing protein [Acidobacteriia bacterium]|nr:HEAT repeat domain-containing protein [Terriglobia bacterium]